MPKPRISRPGVGGAIEDAVDAIRDYAGYGGKRKLPGGTNDEGNPESVDDAVDRMSGTASNAGKQSQSSDASNKY